MFIPCNELDAVSAVFNSAQNKIWKKTGHNLDQIAKIIVGRLEEEGVYPDKIPSCIQAVANIIYSYPNLSCQELNKRMISKGWHNFKIDEHSFKLIKLVSSQIETIVDGLNKWLSKRKNLAEQNKNLWQK